MSDNNPLRFFPGMTPEIAQNILGPDYTPNPLMLPPTATAQTAPTAAPQAQPDYAQMLRVIGGDLSGSLSSGDKLLALSGLLRSATRSGRRAGLTPQQVIGDLQKSKLAELQARQQVETLRQSYEQKQRDAAFVARMLPTLSEEQAAAIRDMDSTAGAEQIRQILLRQRQLFEVFRGEDGKTYERFGDGTLRESEVSLPREIAVAEYDVNRDGIRDRVIVDAQTQQPIVIDGQIQFDQLGETPAQRQAHLDRVAAERGRANRAATSGGGGLTPTLPAKRWVKDPATGRPVERQVYRDAQGRYRNVQTNEEVTLWGGDIPAPRSRSDQ